MFDEPLRSEVTFAVESQTLVHGPEGVRITGVLLPPLGVTATVEAIFEASVPLSNRFTCRIALVTVAPAGIVLLYPVVLREALAVEPALSAAVA